MSSEPLSSSSNGIIAEARIGKTSSDTCELFAPTRAFATLLPAKRAGDFGFEAAAFAAGLATLLVDRGVDGRGDAKAGETFSAA